MKLVAAIKLLPSRDQAASLKETLARCNAAATWLAKAGFDTGTFRQYALHKLAYTGLKVQFGLTAQAAVLTIAKVATAFKVSRKIAPTFRPDAAQPYDDRIIRFTRDGTAVNLWTIEGRITVPFAMANHQRRLMAYRKGEIDLCLIRGKWMLAATCDIPETDEFKPIDWLGVDFGITSLAVDSDGNIHTGADVERVRDRLARRKRGLQKRGTKAAKRCLKKLSGKEARFRTHTSHVISKALVATAKRTGRGIVLEDLTHIRKRVTARRSQRSRLHSWSFGQLRAFITYKAKRCGVPVLFVDAHYTSQTCSSCGTIDRRNRPDQATFVCVSCGHNELADINAARNIRATATVMTPKARAA